MLSFNALSDNEIINEIFKKNKFLSLSGKAINLDYVIKLFK